MSVQINMSQVFTSQNPSRVKPKSVWDSEESFPGCSHSFISRLFVFAYFEMSEVVIDILGADYLLKMAVGHNRLQPVSVAECVQAEGWQWER